MWSVAPAEGFERYMLNRWTVYYQMGAVWEDHVERASELKVVPYSGRIIRVTPHERRGQRRL
jgi:hypothetical protein